MESDLFSGIFVFDNDKVITKETTREEIKDFFPEALLPQTESRANVGSHIFLNKDCTLIFDFFEGGSINHIGIHFFRRELLALVDKSTIPEISHALDNQLLLFRLGTPSNADGKSVIYRLPFGIISTNLNTYEAGDSSVDIYFRQ